MMSKIERVELWRIEPPNEVTDPAKRDRIAQSLADGGWAGRPLLVEQLPNGNVFRAWTGSHRLAAARRANLDEVPVHRIAIQRLDELAAREGLPRLTVDSYFGLAEDDDERLALLDLAGDSEAAQLLRIEIRARNEDQHD